jgi:predicted ArsR family transcriptional regulator
MTAKALAFISSKSHPQSAAQVAEHLGVETTRASQIIHALVKGELVRKHGKRPNMTYEAV